MVETGLRRLNGYGKVTVLCVALGLVAAVAGGATYRSAAIVLFALAGVTVAVAMARAGDDEGYPHDGDDETLSDETQRRQKELEGDKGRAMGEAV